MQQSVSKERQKKTIAVQSQGLSICGRHIDDRINSVDIKENASRKEKHVFLLPVP